MRVELVYKPGCTSYRKALHLLETVIAEERLPIAVVLTETTECHHPKILLEGESLGESAQHCIDEIGHHIAKRWHDLTKMMSHA